MMMIRKKTGYFFIVILKTFVLLKESGAFYTPICPNDCRHGSNKIILCNNGQKVLPMSTIIRTNRGVKRPLCTRDNIWLAAYHILIKLM